MSQFVPTLLRGLYPKRDILHSDANCEVVNRGDFVGLSLHAGWNPSLFNVASRYNVAHITALNLNDITGDSLGFLVELPEVRSVFVSTKRAVNWTPLISMKQLERLILFTHRSEQPEIDFTRLRYLRECTLSWSPQWDSIRNCVWLKSFCIRDSFGLRNLDLAPIVGLEELLLEGCADLKSVNLNDATRIRALKISQCRRLHLEVQRFVKDVEVLWFEGKLAFPLDDMHFATHLRRLMFTFLGEKKALPPILSRLPGLRDAAVLETKLCDADQEILKKFERKQG